MGEGVIEPGGRAMPGEGELPVGPGEFGDFGVWVEADEAADREAGLPGVESPLAAHVVPAGPTGAVVDPPDIEGRVFAVAVGEHAVNDGVDVATLGVAVELVHVLEEDEDGVAGVDFGLEVLEGEPRIGADVGVEVGELAEAVGVVADVPCEVAEAGGEIGDGDAAVVEGLVVGAAEAVGFPEDESVAIDIAVAFAVEVGPLELVEAGEIVDAVRGMFRALGIEVGVGGGGFEGTPVIVDVAGLVGGAAAIAGLGGPEGVDGGGLGEGGESAAEGALVEVGEAVAVPEAEEVAAGGAETAVVPIVIGDFEEIDVGLGGRRRGEHGSEGGEGEEEGGGLHRAGGMAGPPASWEGILVAESRPFAKAAADWRGDERRLSRADSVLMCARHVKWES